MSLVQEYLTQNDERATFWREHAAKCRSQDDWEKHYYRLHLEAWDWAHDYAALEREIERVVCEDPKIMSLLRRLVYTVRKTHVKARGFKSRTTSHTQRPYFGASSFSRACGL